jgi:hypothetical protein
MSNPFDLRFSMIESAKQILIEQYHTDCGHLKEKYFAELERGLDVQFPELPTFPTFGDISNLANEMNSFVSQR